MRNIINPTSVALVTSRGHTEILGKQVQKDNIMTIAWHSPLSFAPELYGICIAKTRFSRKLIDESRVFAVNFVPHQFKQYAIDCGSSTGSVTDKFEKFAISVEECESIDCCRMKDSSAVLECEVIDQFETGDHIFYVGKVIKSICRDDRKRLLYMGDNIFSSTL